MQKTKGSTNEKTNLENEEDALVRGVVIMLFLYGASYCSSKYIIRLVLE